MANDLRLRVLLDAIDQATAPLKQIDKASLEAGRQLKAARDRLKELNAQQKDVSAWRTQLTQTQETTQALEAARAKVRAIAQEMAATGAPTKAMASNMRTAVREAQRLKTEHQQQAEKLQQLRGKLYSAGISTRDLGSHERKLREQITSTNEAISTQSRRMEELASRQAKLAKARAALERTQGLAAKMAGTGAAGLATGYAAAQPVKAVLGAFAPNEDSATQLKVSMMDSNGKVAEDFKKISDLATSLGDRLPGTTADFQNMMTMLRRQGLSAKSILGGTGEAAAYLGVQLKMPVEEAAEFAAKMQDATSTTEKDMMALMDVIQRGFYAGVDPDNMMQGFSKIAPVMDVIKKTGIEAVNELGPLLVMMDQASMEGGAAGNAFRKIFQAGLKKDKVDGANELLAKQNIKLSFTNEDGNFAGLENLYKQIDKLKVLNDEDRTAAINKLFGDDAETMTVLNKMMEKGLAGYQEVQQKLKDQADLRTRVNEQLNTLSNVMEAAEGSFTNAMAEFGAAVAPELKELITTLGEIAASVGAWARENPALAGGLVKVVAAVAVLAAGFGGLAITMASLLGPFAMVRYGMALFGVKSSGMFSVVGRLVGVMKGGLLTAIRAVSIALWGLAANPVALAIAAVVAALAGAAYLIYQNWDQVKAYFSNAWTEIRAGFGAGIGGILTVLANFSPIGLIYQAFAAVLNYLGVDMPSRFTEFGNMIVNGLVNGLMSGLGQIKDAVSALGDSTIGWFKEKLGIHSPSRVFAELGGFTTEGLAMGLDDGAKAPLEAVNRMGQQLTDAGTFALKGTLPEFNGGGPLAAGGTPITMDDRAPLGAAPAASYDSHDTYEINIHPTPGMDALAIGRAVRAELARIDSEKAARQRSRLTDQE
ncbi:MULTISPECIES: phage tail tape measure protein [unclassified Pseudomonas]|uniref:phage tail tape measure protein n=1 Tax=unclassified Pseudomonas TaxID=196821 RepID=UPI0024488C5F|nr:MULTISPECIES: phage tail tape measure protein [unclassified Pseudomonas]MDH0301249.1 phage tail tape measure protein [Pseudomonas sp. GD04091]MDH1984681.1 phage tail tape measure protein [Pseudomonas sp. GD03689]